VHDAFESDSESESCKRESVNDERSVLSTVSVSLERDPA